MIALFCNFGISTALHCGDNVKHGLLSKHLFQRKQSQSNDKLLEKMTSSSYHME